MIEYLRELLDEPWRPVPRWAGAVWIAFYALFAIYAFSQHGGFLFIDSANLVVHEGGHNLFGWFGPTLGLWGGTVLQWLALESIFKEGRFSIFDFTEGQSDHKRFFATDSVGCANVYFLRKTLSNSLLIRAHIAMEDFSKKTGDLLDRMGLKAKIKKLIRFGL